MYHFHTLDQRKQRVYIWHVAHLTLSGNALMRNGGCIFYIHPPFLISAFLKSVVYC